MGGTSYNGYDWRQRAKIIPAHLRKTGSRDPFPGAPCAMCGDPGRAEAEWHSEDYSEPFIFEPPASYPVCKPCHGRLHKRFNAPPGEWELFCRHVEAGGHGSEFVKLHKLAERKALAQQVSSGTPILLTQVRPRDPGPYWWRTLTLDSEALDAPWARPRPLRPRPDTEAYRSALRAIDVSESEERLMRLYAVAPRRAATMRDLGHGALDTDTPSAANLAYGRLARRLCVALIWSPDKRTDGSPVWMSVVAEGWQPPVRDGKKREYEWVMVPSLAGVWQQ